MLPTTDPLSIGSPVNFKTSVVPPHPVIMAKTKLIATARPVYLRNTVHPFDWALAAATQVADLTE
jgi:hypothetical protein